MWNGRCFLGTQLILARWVNELQNDLLTKAARKMSPLHSLLKRVAFLDKATNFFKSTAKLHKKERMLLFKEYVEQQFYNYNYYIYKCLH